MGSGRKANSEYIIDALLSGENLSSRDITERVSALSGKEMKIQDIASILAKLSNSNNCDLGYLIKRKKTNKSYTYNLLPELRELAPERLYDLSRKKRKGCYTLEQAIADYPKIKRHINSARLKGPSAKLNLQPGVPASARNSRIPITSAGRSSSGVSFIKPLVRLIAQAADQGGLRININLSIRLSDFDTE